MNTGKDDTANAVDNADNVIVIGDVERIERTDEECQGIVRGLEVVAPLMEASQKRYAAINKQIEENHKKEIRKLKEQIVAMRPDYELGQQFRKMQEMAAWGNECAWEREFPEIVEDDLERNKQVN